MGGRQTEQDGAFLKLDCNANGGRQGLFVTQNKHKQNVLLKAKQGHQLQTYLYLTEPKGVCLFIPAGECGRGMQLYHAPSPGS